MLTNEAVSEAKEITLGQIDFLKRVEEMWLSSVDFSTISVQDILKVQERIRERTHDIEHIGFTPDPDKILSYDLKNFFNMGMIDQTEVLKRAGFSNWEEIVDRMSLHAGKRNVIGRFSPDYKKEETL